VLRFGHVRFPYGPSEDGKNLGDG